MLRQKRNISGIINNTAQSDPRPTKIVRRFLNMGLSFEETGNILKDIYFVSEEKIRLLLNVVKKGMKYVLDKYN